MDLLAELREERGKHAIAASDRGGYCWDCGIREPWPCPTARALDVVIAAAEFHTPTKGEVSCCECIDDPWPCRTYKAMTAAWEKGR